MQETKQLSGDEVSKYTNSVGDCHLWSHACQSFCIMLQHKFTQATVKLTAKTQSSAQPPTECEKLNKLLAASYLELARTRIEHGKHKTLVNIGGGLAAELALF